jgi:LacI family transcriptional regulator
MQGGEAAMVELLGRNLGLSAVLPTTTVAAGALTTLKDNGIACRSIFR